MFCFVVFAWFCFLFIFLFVLFCFVCLFSCVISITAHLSFHCYVSSQSEIWGYYNGFFYNKKIIMSKQCFLGICTFTYPLKRSRYSSWQGLFDMPYVECAPLRKNAVSALHIPSNYFRLPWKIPKEFSRRCMLFQKDSIYHIKHYVHRTFYHSGGLTRRIWWRYLICFIFYRYCGFTWSGRNKLIHF